MNEYWDKRFQNEGKIWGETPSRTAVYALELFTKEGVKKIVVPGSGYGRNTKLFSAAGIKVTGMEISETAVNFARKYDSATRVYHDSVLDMSILGRNYDAVYCFNVLHLFRSYDRQLLVQQCLGRIKKDGLLFFTVFSEKEDSCGIGKKTEQNTFESKPGRAAHYFTEDDLKATFKNTEIIETGIMKDPEDHGGGPHVHNLRYIYARKKK
jgi:2-polyprenyl-3-methyl-5-hydroxy-6-metoxy-1,4-benzoquinol methylase